MLEQFPAIKLPDDEEGQGEDMETKEGQISPTRTAVPAVMNNVRATTSNIARHQLHEGHHNHAKAKETPLRRGVHTTR